MNYNILGYSVYFSILFTVIIYIGRELFRTGRSFCANSFNGNMQMGDAINKMLLSGYYLINLGYCVFILMIREEIPTARRLIEVLSFKLGAIVLALGIMHIFNVIVLGVIGKMKNKSIHINNN